MQWPPRPPQSPAFTGAHGGSGTAYITAVIVKGAKMYWLPFSGLKSKRNKQSVISFSILLLIAGILLRLIFDPESGGDTFLRNAGTTRDIRPTIENIKTKGHKQGHRNRKITRNREGEVYSQTNVF
jgi:hypothetical protein